MKLAFLCLCICVFALGQSVRLIGIKDRLALRWQLQTMTYHDQLLAKPVPRYTSYPTAAEFHDDVGAAEQAEGLAAISQHEPFSLYLHIPYCEKICFYCGCNTAAANRRARVAAYLDRLHEEIELVARQLEGRGRLVRIAFGGGSPNAILPDQMRGLATHILDALGGDKACWSTELDPRGFDAEFAAALNDCGFTRASLGVQTICTSIQQAIGRVQPFELINNSTRLLREAGITSLNFDLMYGLPGQSEDVLLDSLDQCLSLSPDRLAIFGYAHVPHIVPRQRQIDDSDLPDAKARFGQAEAVRSRLVALDWQQVGFDHFARAGDPMAQAARNGSLRRNFQGYTDDPCRSLIGLGASAISRFGASLVQNEKNAGRYGTRVANGVFPATRGIRLNAMDHMIGDQIERLLCQGVARIDHLPEAALIARDLEPFTDQGLAVIDHGLLKIRAHGWPYARAMSAKLDPWRRQSARQFSAAI